MTAQETLEAEQAQMIGLITGMITGMPGGDIANAATARYALQRFEQQHKRKTTPRDAVTVVAMIHDMK